MTCKTTLFHYLLNNPFGKCCRIRYNPVNTTFYDMQYTVGNVNANILNYKKSTLLPI